MKTTDRHPLDPALWLAQWLLAGAFSISGLLKTTLDDGLLARLGLASGEQAQRAGALELTLALAVILPAATRLAPRLSVAAAAAMGALALLGAASPAGPLGVGAAAPDLLLAAVALFAVWGRAVAAPIAALDGSEDEESAPVHAPRGERADAEAGESAAQPAWVSQETARVAARRPPPESAPGWDLSAVALAAGAAHDLP